MKGVLILFISVLAGFSWAGGSRDFVQEKINYIEQPVSTVPFSKQHQLVFFFASSCPHCHNAAPHLKRWADEHEMFVRAISFDKQSLPQFPNLMEASQDLIRSAFAERTIEYPALFIMNTDTLQLYPVMVGEFNKTQLEQRLQILIPKIQHYEGSQE